jgi:AraC-like DNA-binding protein
MRILFLPASLARLVPGHPAVFMVSGLAREILLTLTGPRNYDRAARNDDRAARDYDRAALARLRRVLVDELHEAHEQPLQLPEPRDDRLQAIAEMLYKQPADNTSLAELGQAIGASSRTLSRLFHDELGMTFYEWRTQLRIYHALVLLADGHDTTHVAHACGWANPAASSRPSPASSAPRPAATEPVTSTAPPHDLSSTGAALGVWRPGRPRRRGDPAGLDDVTA